jgi:hypothetical protein
MRRPPAWLIATATLLCAAGCSSQNPKDPPSNGVSLTVDGKKQTVSGSVSCSSHSAGDAIKVGKLPDGIYVHIAPQMSGVEDIELGNSTGKSLVGANSQLSLLQDGSYDITGEAVPKDKQDSSAPKPFELKIKCPGS